MNRKPLLWLGIVVLLAVAADARAAGHRRALLIGINDYTASRLDPRPRPAPPPDRDWQDLAGGVNDVEAMQEMLVLLYGFDRHDIVTLTDQAATRAAILQSLEEHLVNGAAKDDVALFYYAGHGSQVRNSLSDERDKLDESLVPADSRLGILDIRDKELRPLFNRIIDRGARLTVILDNCHSGSGARGLGTGARPRGVRPDLRDVAHRTIAGPRPEDRGALVLSASHDFDQAWETRDGEGKFHGAFSWAWLRAMRDSSAGESADEMFQRARARLRAETPYQEPVMAGNGDARHTPFLGGRNDRRAGRAVVAVEKTRPDGTVMIAGGWANGLSVDSELRAVGGAATLTVTALRGLTHSEAHLTNGHAIASGTLLEVISWAAPPDKPLRVWAPRRSGSLKDLAAVARSLAAEAAQHGVRWVTDPTDVTPAHLLRWSGREWELLGPEGTVERVGTDAAAIAAVAKMPTGSSLFVQFPAPAVLVGRIATVGVEAIDRAEGADYILVGRYSSRHLSYAWVRPAVRKSDRRRSGLPPRTAWISERRHDKRLRNTVPSLREAVLRLRKIHAWNLLESPAEGRFPYQLAARRIRDGELARDFAMMGEEKYELVLRAISMPLPERVPQRYVYAFAIDSYGKSTLLFPPGGSGSVENRFPLTAAEPEIALGDASAFEISRPYGIDTYFLLATDEPLPDPWVLEWDGVRSPPTQTLTPLEQLLMLTGSGTRAPSRRTRASWSIERVVYESLPPRTTNGHK